MDPPEDQENFLDSLELNPGVLQYRVNQSVVNHLNSSCNIGRENY